jgi:Zn finger protein HypA/HybF involved in hydrogenase expression
MEDSTTLLAVDLELAATCPACNHAYSEDITQECPECGSSRPLAG